jgi:hypothetical protein
MTGLSDCFE